RPWIEPPARHMLGIAHQLVKLNLGGGHKSAGAAPTFHQAFALQSGQGVASRHQTHLVGFGQFAFRLDQVPRLQLRRFDAGPDGVLDAFIYRGAVAMISRHGTVFWPNSWLLSDQMLPVVNSPAQTAVVCYIA